MQPKKIRGVSFILMILCLLLSVSSPIDAETKTYKRGHILKKDPTGFVLETYMGTKTHTVKKQTKWVKKTARKKQKKTRKTDTRKESLLSVKTWYKDGERQRIETYKVVKTTKYLKKNKKTYKCKKQVIKKQRVEHTKLYQGDLNPSTTLNKNPVWLNQAFKDMNYKLTVDSAFSRYPEYNNPDDRYVGLFDSDYGITVRDTNPDTTYHEFGHFLALLAGDVYSSPELKEAFEQEKDKPNFGNPDYGKTKPNEYFACSYANYILRPKQLKKATPKTYAFVEKTLEKGKLKAEILTANKLKSTIQDEDKKQPQNPEIITTDIP